MNKKIIATLTTIFLSFFVITSALAYSSVYKDVKPSDWFNRYVTFMTDYHIMSGDNKGYFKPNSQITKAELAKTLYNFNQYVNNNLETINSQTTNEIDTKIKQHKEATAVEVSNMIDSKIASIENEEQKTINLIANTMPSIALVEQDNSSGTGFFISNNQILTNYHVINNQGTIKVSLVTGQKYNVKVLKSDANKDLALLEVVGGNNFNFLQFTDNKVLGQNVLIIGNPEGISFAASKGMVSRINLNDSNNYMDLIQVDAAINPGNSGSPVIDDNGKVMGIVVSKYVGEEVDNIGFAISYETIKQFLGR